MGQIYNFVTGWANYLTGFTSDQAKARASKCYDCEHAVEAEYEEFLPDNSLVEVKGLICNICKCPLSALCRSPKKKCPDNPPRW